MVVFVRIEEEKFNRVKGSENNLKIFVSNMGYDVDLKVLRLIDFFSFFVSIFNF